MKKKLPTARLIVDGIPTRATTTCVNFNRLGQVAVGECLRHDLLGTWQLPQGGWNEHEMRMDACLRENREEFGFSKEDLFFIGAAPRPFVYSMLRPNERYQDVQLVVAAFLVKDGVQWNLNSSHNDEPPEFRDAQWIEPDQLPNIVAPHKRDAYVRIATIFKPASQALKIFNQAEIRMPSEELAQKILKNEFVQAAYEAGQLQAEIPPFLGQLSPWSAARPV